MINRIPSDELEDLFADKVAVDNKPVDDNINHPSHYTYGKIECIDFIMDKNLDFCRGNAIKYIIRAGRKEGSPWYEDIEKAIKYLEMYMAHKSKTDAELGE